MAKRQNKLEIVYEFLDKLEEQIIVRLSDEVTIKDVIRHLCEYGLIEPKRLRNYMIISDFDNLLKKNEGNITHTFCDLAIKYEMSESQVGRVVYKERKKGHPKYNIRVE